MRREPKRLIPGETLDVNAAVLYTVPAGTVATISAMTLVNVSNAVVNVTVHLVSAGLSPFGSNAILWARNLAPGESRVVGEAIAQSMHQGGTIQALASAANSITIVASGYETVL